jgi:hypothetical protein
MTRMTQITGADRSVWRTELPSATSPKNGVDLPPLLPNYRTRLLPGILRSCSSRK